MYPSDPHQMPLSKPTPLFMSLLGGSINTLGGVEVCISDRGHGIIPTHIIGTFLVARLARNQKIGVYAVLALSRT